MSVGGSLCPSLAATLATTCATVRIPGIAVATLGFCRMNRKASSGSVIPSGTTRLSASTRSNVGRRFSGVK